MSIATIERAVNARWYGFDAAAFEQRWADCAAAAERGEPVESFHQVVGRIEIEPGLLEDVVGALLQESVQTVSSANPDLSGFWLEEEVLSIKHDLLRPFFRVTSKRLLEVMQMQPYRIPKKYHELRLTAQPYEYSAGDDWHRDMERYESATISHTSVLYGPFIRHANDFFSESDFRADDRQMLRNPVDPANYQTYHPGEVVMHHGFASVHAAPPPDDNGLLRIFMNMRSWD